MPRRQETFPAGSYYHVFNRGVNKAPIFFAEHDFQRAYNLLDYYRYAHPPLRYSFLIDLSRARQDEILESLRRSQEYLVTVVAFCLMPNHYHFLLKSVHHAGIPKFLQRWQDSFAKYINVRYDRSGPLFQGPFRAVRVVSDEHLLHLSRYIHLNPLTSRVVTNRPSLLEYPWSSFGAYIGRREGGLCSSDLVLSFFRRPNDYQSFVLDRAGYQQSLAAIKHLVLD